jgi:outer membrane lipoprotein carrier protein
VRRLRRTQRTRLVLVGPRGDRAQDAVACQQRGGKDPLHEPHHKEGPVRRQPRPFGEGPVMPPLNSLIPGALLCAALAASGSFAAPAAPGTPAAQKTDPILSRLQARLDKLTSLRGRFVQSLDSASLGRPRTEQGRFMIRRPDRMRWEYESPEKKLAVVDGRNAWLYLPEEAEAHRGPADSGQSGALGLLSGALRLDRDFGSRRPGPKELAAELPLPAGTVVIELTPHRADLDFQKLLLAVDPDRLQIRKLIVIDPLGDRMSFTFSDLEEDVALQDSLFHFEPPPGVRVVEGEGPAR